jgi:trans-aconitate methyltransferase
MLTPTQAQHWLDRWDRQQEFYIAQREQRFRVIGDVIALAVSGTGPLIVDLGAGPGSLSVRLADRFPTATVVAVDADPLLLGLAGAAYGDRPGLRFVERDLRIPGWVDALDLPGPADAVVSTTALHWLTRPELAGVYRECGQLLAPGGVLVNGDNFAEGTDRLRLDALNRGLERDHADAARATALSANGASAHNVEDWDAWWAAVDAAPELAALRAERGERSTDHSLPELPTLGDHVDLLYRAGFTEVGPVWQDGDDRVLVALR